MPDPALQPRLAPVAPDDLTPEQLELLGPTGGARSLDIFRTLVRHPGLYRRWSPFGGKLLRGGKLAERDRELIILRTAWRCGAGYEWGQHVSIARQAGLTDAEITRVAQGATPGPEGRTGPDSADPASWAAEDATLLTAVDQLVADHVIGDAVWAELRGHYTDEQLIEVTLLAGHYAMLAGALNSFGTQVDGDQPPLGRVGP
jgi:4-carboxymuconolactone decarboxylase